MMPPLRLIFMGTPEFAVPALRALVDAGHHISAAYTQPPRPAGRGQKPRPSPVQQCAEKLGIHVETPTTLRNAEVQERIYDIDADAIIVAAYGLLLPPEVLEATPLGCLNIHPSLLPRWRGAAPIPWPILAGDEETGIAIMLMDEGLDTGPVLSMESLLLPPEATSGEMHDLLAQRGADMLVKTLESHAAGDIEPEPQPDEGTTYARKITKADCPIDWCKPAADVLHHIHGLSPWPGATTLYGVDKLKILRATLSDLPLPAHSTPGTVLDDQLSIACGDGAVRILEAQRPGKSTMPTDAMLRGYPIPSGSKLE